MKAYQRLQRMGTNCLGPSKEKNDLEAQVNQIYKDAVQVFTAKGNTTYEQFCNAQRKNGKLKRLVSQLNNSARSLQSVCISITDLARDKGQNYSTMAQLLLFMQELTTFFNKFMQLEEAQGSLAETHIIFQQFYKEAFQMLSGGQNRALALNILKALNTFLAVKLPLASLRLSHLIAMFLLQHAPLLAQAALSLEAVFKNLFRRRDDQVDPDYQLEEFERALALKLVSVVVDYILRLTPVFLAKRAVKTLLLSTELDPYLVLLNSLEQSKAAGTKGELYKQILEVVIDEQSLMDKNLKLLKKLLDPTRIDKTILQIISKLVNYIIKAISFYQSEKNPAQFSTACQCLSLVSRFVKKNGSFQSYALELLNYAQIPAVNSHLEQQLRYINPLSKQIESAVLKKLTKKTVNRPLLLSLLVKLNCYSVEGLKFILLYFCQKLFSLQEGKISQEVNLIQLQALYGLNSREHLGVGLFEQLLNSLKKQFAHSKDGEQILLLSYFFHKCLPELASQQNLLARLSVSPFPRTFKILEGTKQGKKPLRGQLEWLSNEAVNYDRRLELDEKQKFRGWTLSSRKLQDSIFKLSQAQKRQSFCLEEDDAQHFDDEHYVLSL